MNACIGKGFAKDAKRTFCACHAYKTDGSHLSAMYSELSREMQIALYAPKQFTELLWSEIVMMEDVPKPRSPCGNTKIGDIMHNSSDEFIAHIGKTSTDDFQALQTPARTPDSQTSVLTVMIYSMPKTPTATVSG